MQPYLPSGDKQVTTDIVNTEARSLYDSRLIDGDPLWQGPPSHPHITDAGEQAARTPGGLAAYYAPPARDAVTVHTNYGNFNAALGGSVADQVVVPAGMPDQLRELADQLRPHFAADPSSQLLLDELAEADAGTQPSRIS